MGSHAPRPRLEKACRGASRSARLQPSGGFLWTPTEVVPSWPTRPPRRRLDRALARASDAPLREGNHLELLRNGPDTYEDWLAAIAGARRWVHLDNYIFQDDQVGDRFAEALISKAGEGVRVRVLYDLFGCLDVRRSFWRRMREAGVEVRAVNPPTLGGPFGATTASCSPWTESMPRPVAYASRRAGS